MGPLGCGGLQSLRGPWEPRVRRYALLYITMKKSRGIVLHPLMQASQCLLLLTSEERQNLGCVKDFPGGGLSRSR